MPKMYEALAEAFHAEGVDTQFVLMGDGNMHWSTAFAKLPGVETVHVRHEHATVAAATAASRLERASAVNLKFLPVFPRVHRRNFKFINRTRIIRMLVLLMFPKFA